jgi:hypothetical protein
MQRIFCNAEITDAEYSCAGFVPVLHFLEKPAADVRCGLCIDGGKKLLDDRSSLWYR